jgi:hypothetical protein
MPRFQGIPVACDAKARCSSSAPLPANHFPAYHDFKLFLQHLCRFAGKTGCYIFSERL